MMTILPSGSQPFQSHSTFFNDLFGWLDAEFADGRIDGHPGVLGFLGWGGHFLGLVSVVAEGGSCRRLGSDLWQWFRRWGDDCTRALGLCCHIRGVLYGFNALE